MSTGQLTESLAGPAVQSPAAAATRPPRRPRSLTTRRAWSFYLFAGPWMLGFLGLTAYPLGYALWLSFTNSDGLSDHSRFVGLDNYKAVFSDSETLHSLARTGLFTVTTVPLSIVAGLFLAVLVNQPIRAAASSAHCCTCPPWCRRSVPPSPSG